MCTRKHRVPPTTDKSYLIHSHWRNFWPTIKLKTSRWCWYLIIKCIFPYWIMLLHIPVYKIERKKTKIWIFKIIVFFLLWWSRRHRYKISLIDNTKLSWPRFTELSYYNHGKTSSSPWLQPIDKSFLSKQRRDFSRSEGFFRHFGCLREWSYIKGVREFFGENGRNGDFSFKSEG